MSVLGVNVEADVDFFTSLRRDRTPNLSPNTMKENPDCSSQIIPGRNQISKPKQQAKGIPNEHGLTQTLFDRAGFCSEKTYMGLLYLSIQIALQFECVLQRNLNENYPSE